MTPIRSNARLLTLDEHMKMGHPEAPRRQMGGGPSLLRVGSPTALVFTATSLVFLLVAWSGCTRSPEPGSNDPVDAGDVADASFVPGNGPRNDAGVVGDGGGEDPEPLVLSGSILYLGDMAPGVVTLREMTSGEELIIADGETEFSFQHEFRSGEQFQVQPAGYAVSVDDETQTLGWGCWATGAKGVFEERPIGGVEVTCGRNIVLNPLDAFYGNGDGVVTYLFQALDAGHTVGPDQIRRPVTRSQLTIDNMRLTERRADQLDPQVIDISEQAAIRPDYFLEIRPLEDLEFRIPTVLVLDNSNSLSGEEREQIKHAAGTLISEDCSDPEAKSKLLANQQMAIYTFNDSVNLLIDFTDDHVALCETIQSISGAGVTAGRQLYNAISQGLDRWEDQTSLSGITQGFLAVFSVGVDVSGASLADVIAKRNTSDKHIFAIGIDDGRDSVDLDGNSACDALDRLGNANLRPLDLDEEESIACQPDFSLIEQQFAEVETSLNNLVNSIFFLNYASPRDVGRIDARIEVRDNAFRGVGSGIRVEYQAIENSAAPELLVLGDRNLTPSGTRTLSGQVRWTEESVSYLWDYGAVPSHCDFEPPDVTPCEADAGLCEEEEEPEPDPECSTQTGICSHDLWEHDTNCIIAVNASEVASADSQLELTAVRTGTATLRVDADIDVFGLLSDASPLTYPLELDLVVSPVTAQIPSTARRSSQVAMSAVAEEATEFQWQVAAGSSFCQLRNPANGTTATSLYGLVPENGRSDVQLVTNTSEGTCTIEVRATIEGMVQGPYRKRVVVGSPGSSQLTLYTLGDPDFGEPDEDTLGGGSPGEDASQVLTLLAEQLVFTPDEFEVEVPMGASHLVVTVSGASVPLEIMVGPAGGFPFLDGTWCDVNPLSAGQCQVVDPAPGLWTITVSPLEEGSYVTTLGAVVHLY